MFQKTKKSFYCFLVLLVSLEILSYVGYLFPVWGEIFFWLIAASVLILSIKNIKYGIWAAFLELFIGSKGYLFSTNILGTQISIRIAIWLIVMSVWGTYFLTSIFKKDKDKKSIFLLPQTYKEGYVRYFFALFFFIAFAFLNGVAKNNFSDVFLDFNGYLYFALLFPLFETFFNKNISGDNQLSDIASIFFAAISWVFLKTAALLYLFSHSFPLALIQQTYRWVRNTGVGEITMMDSGFVRIFFQSHIFALVSFYAVLMICIKFADRIKQNKKYLFLVIAVQTINIFLIMISYSRSFWVGLVAVFPVFIFLSVKNNWKKIFFGILIIFISAIASALLITIIIKFPLPRSGAEFNVTEALTDRAKKINNEAAVSSRYSLLPELWSAIKKDAIIGGGFGKTVSYHSSDPRVLENNPDGLYTTFAFEWGWLDAWLKLGIFGVLFYAYFFFKVIKDSLKNKKLLTDIIIVSLVILATVNFFTPYINHPLGIGLFLLSIVMISHCQKSSSCI